MTAPLPNKPRTHLELSPPPPSAPIPLPSPSLPTIDRPWSLAQIREKLSQKLPSSVTSTKKQGGETLTFVPWYRAAEILHKYCPGWSWEVKSITTYPCRTNNKRGEPVTLDGLVLVGRLTVPTAEGPVYYEATGFETLETVGYGDPASNAESMALRRAAAKLGLGLYLYDKEQR